MRVVLFIGHHKVGSTSLQDFLARNSVALARAGILYPATDFESMALMLAAATGRGALPETLPINAREPHNALAFRMLAEHKQGKVPPFHKGLPGRAQMFRAIRMQIQYLRPEVVILAAEVFANFSAAGTELIAPLAELFPEAEITVIATLRRIDDYLASWHGQRLKFGHQLAPLREGGMQGYFGNIHFDYRLMLEGWMETLPEARFILRDYADVRAAGGSVADFIAQLDLTVPEGLAAEQRTNESLHRGVYEVARRGNRALPADPAGRLRGFLRQVTPELGLPASGDIELFGAANRKLMVDRFEPVADFLDRASGKAPFFPDLQEARETRPVPEMAVFADVVERLRQRRREIEDDAVRDFLQNLNASAETVS